MRKAKYLLTAVVAGGVALAAVLTAALVANEPALFVASVWIATFTLVGLTVFLLRSYQRVVTRLGTANERLAELKFLQERRYEQLAARLDGRVGNSGSGASAQSLADLENLNARLERSERRILGKLENEILINDKRYRELKSLMLESPDRVSEPSDDSKVPET